MPATKLTTTQRILSEDVLTLNEARKELQGILGRRPDKTTLYRWCFRGVKGVKLDHCWIGNRIIVSRQALTRFIEARTEAGSR